jgi:hypothetical protein
VKINKEGDKGRGRLRQWRRMVRSRLRVLRSCERLDCYTLTKSTFSRSFETFELSMATIETMGKRGNIPSSKNRGFECSVVERRL